MKYISELTEMTSTCVAYGAFDSVHAGHLKVAERVVEEAKKANLQAVLVSFRSEEAVLTTECEKEVLLKEVGLDVMMSVEKTEASSEAFVKDILAGKLGAKVLVVGENHNDLDNVKKAAKESGIRVVVVDNVRDDEGIITTERVKVAFEESDFEKITKICGHPYIICGEIVHGKALGRTVGMPTANMGVPDNKRKPLDGVYATLAYVVGGKYKSLTNIGKRPSVDNHDYITIEVFLLDFKQDIYGEPMCIEVHKGIRGVHKFNNLEEVQQQVQKDLAQVRNFLDTLV